LPGELVSEALGTAIIILFGCGSVAMTVAALNQSDRGKLPFAASGDWLLITTGWGVGVALAVWVAGGVSGAHLNGARSCTSTTTTRSRRSTPRTR